MAEEHDVKILQWPKQKAMLEHYFQLDKPCPVSIHFDEKPAHVKVGNERGERFNVDMNMNFKAVEEIPVCIKLCEPICAVSDYSIGIELLGQPLASIRLKGKTKIDNCRDDDKPVKNCVNFIGLDTKGVKSPMTHQGIQFTPLNGAPIVSFTTMGEPNGQLKLSIPDEGLRLDFATLVFDVDLTIVNFGNPVIQVNAFSNGTLVSDQSVMIQNKTSNVIVPGSNITAIEIKGGSNEAALVDVCFRRQAAFDPGRVTITQ